MPGSLAREIPGAVHLELPGEDHAPFGDDMHQILGEIQGFLELAWQEASRDDEPDRVLTTVLFTDIVDSTPRRASSATPGGASSCRATIAPSDANSSGTGAASSTPRGTGSSRASTAPPARSAALRYSGRGRRRRPRDPCRLHTGECEVLDGKVAGIAVATGARIASLAGPGDVLVSATVRDLVAGSGIAFDDRGMHVLKGLPEERRVYAVTAG